MERWWVFGITPNDLALVKFSVHCPVLRAKMSVFHGNFDVLMSKQFLDCKKICPTPRLA